MPKHLNKIPLISGIIVLIVTITPFNVIDMPVRSQSHILETTLNANNMLQDGKVIPNANVSDDDAERILSAYEYLKYDAQKVPGFIHDSTKSNQEIFGFTSDYNGNRSNYIYCNFTSKDSVDISGYDNMIRVSGHEDIIRAEHNGKQYEIDLRKLARDLYDQYGTEYEELEIYPVNENMALYISDFGFDMEDDEITSCYLNGYVLLKD